MRSRSGAELPQLELDCLAVLWALEAAPVSGVHARLAARGRPLAYTTVLTVLDRLLRKGAVARTKRGRAFVYTPRLTRAEMRERALDRLVGNYFDSRQELRRYLDGGGKREGGSGAAPPVVAPLDGTVADEPAPLLD
ncbi:MAG TPA: BlaI/MecI/CopY family transcriptional regulator [Terriglobales bacterium]|nr:BlaI/MecI/CopY family transcriptional regulator [Terriglobales bacterium]